MGDQSLEGGNSGGGGKKADLSGDRGRLGSAACCSELEIAGVSVNFGQSAVCGQHPTTVSLGVLRVDLLI